jgi:hypothetical protein
VNGALFTVDPVGGEYLVFGRDGSFWAYDVTRDAWTRQPGSDFFSPTTNADGGIISQVVAAPVSSYGVVMFAKFNYASSNVYLYKHTGSAGVENALPSSKDMDLPDPSIVYDIRGRVKARLSAGMAWNKAGVPAGIYFIRSLVKTGATRRVAVY